MTNDPRLQLSTFAAWLRAQPSDAIYGRGPSRCRSCPVAMYGEGYANRAFIQLNGEIVDAPSWVWAFIERFDGMYDGSEWSYSQEDALRALAFVEYGVGFSEFRRATLTALQRSEQP